MKDERKAILENRGKKAIEKSEDISKILNQYVEINAGATEDDGYTLAELSENSKELPPKVEQALQEVQELADTLSKTVVETLDEHQKYVAVKSDNKAIQKGGLPTGETYTRVMKAVTRENFTTDEELKQGGIVENADLGILYRLLPTVAYQTGILINIDNGGLPFTSTKEIAEYLQTSTKAVSRAINRLVKRGVLVRRGKVYCTNYDYLICGNISRKTIKARASALKGTYKQGTRRDIIANYQKHPLEKTVEQSGENWNSSLINFQERKQLTKVGGTC